MINVTSFAKAKETNNGTGSGKSTGFANSSYSTSKGVKGIYLWGQYHDHSKNINGTIKCDGDIQSSGTISAVNAEITDGLSAHDITSTTITNSGNLTNGGDITNEGNITTNGDLSATNVNASGDIVGKTVEATQVTTEGLKVTDKADINAETVKTSEIETMKVIEAYIKSLQSDTITVDNLTVTKAAHFFSLIIDEIRSAQGQFIISPAHTTIDYVEKQDDGQFKCYFKATDGTKQKYQNFVVGDQVVCQTFNAAEGTSYNVSNKFYWRLCTEISTTTTKITIDGEETECWYIVLSDTDKDANSNADPEKEDEIVVLGSRYDTERQSAINIGAYNNAYLDKEIKAPFFVQYVGVNDYNLSTHRGNTFSNGYNNMVGKFTTNSGDDIEDLINQSQQGLKSYIHTAYADNSTGTKNFSKTYYEGALYMGICSNYTESDTDLIYSNYTWMRLRGEDGDTKALNIWKLVPIYEQANISADKTVKANFCYRILRINGQNVEIPTQQEIKDANINLSIQAYTQLQGKLLTWTSQTSNYYYYVNNEYQKDWSGLSTDVQWFDVSMSIDGVNYDERKTYAQFTAYASLSITDEITAQVQGNAQDIDTLSGKVTSNTNAITTINEKYNEISATVEGHTTSINNLDGRITNNETNITNITADLNGLTSTVEKHTSEINTLNGDVTQNTNDISTLKQTANEITTTVQSLGQERRNLLRNTYHNAVFHNYGVCKRQVTLVANKTYTLTAKGRSMKDLVDAGGYTTTFIWRNDSSGTWNESYSVKFKTTEWETLHITFKPKVGGTWYVQSYPQINETTQGESTTYTGVIAWVQLEEGDVSTPYSLSEYDNIYNENLLPSLETMQHKSLNGTSGTKYCQIIKDGLTLEGGAKLDVMKAVLSASETTTYGDFLYWNEKFIPASNETYTLSFYIKGSGTLWCYLYPTVTQGVLVDGQTAQKYGDTRDTGSDGNTSIIATDDWVRHTVTFTTLYNAEAKNVLPLRLIKKSTDQEVYVAGVKLEKGGRATDFVASQLSTSYSEIKQTADEITSTVTEIKQSKVGDNLLEGTGSGQYWYLQVIDSAEGTVEYKEPTFQESGFQFTLPYQEYQDDVHSDTIERYLYSPPIQNYDGTITISFGAWQTDVRLRVYEIKSETSNKPTDWYKDSTTYPKTLVKTVSTSDVGEGINQLHYDETLKRYYITVQESSSDVYWFGLVFDNMRWKEYGGTSSDVYVQQVMVEMGSTPHNFEMSYATNQSMIKQNADNITLNANTVMVKNGDQLSALFEDGKIKASWIGSMGGLWQITDEGFYYKATREQNPSLYEGEMIESKIYPWGFSTQVNETTDQTQGYAQYVQISPYSRDYNVDIMSGSQGAIRVQSLRLGLDDALSIQTGAAYGLRHHTEVVYGTKTQLSTYERNIVVRGISSYTTEGIGSVAHTLILPDNENLTNGALSKKIDSAAYHDYYLQYKRCPQYLQVGQEYIIYKLSNGTLTITIDEDTQSYYPIYANTSNTEITKVYSVTIPASYKGIVRVIFDGYGWNLLRQW